MLESTVVRRVRHRWERQRSASGVIDALNHIFGGSPCSASGTPTAVQQCAQQQILRQVAIAPRRDVYNFRAAVNELLAQSLAVGYAQATPAVETCDPSYRLSLPAVGATAPRCMEALDSAAQEILGGFEQHMPLADDMMGHLVG